MKKRYEKPQIVFEDFTLTTNIAGTCEGIVGNPTQGTCAVSATGGIQVFSGMVSACVYKPEDLGFEQKDEWDGFCYHVPTQYNNLFNS